MAEGVAVRKILGGDEVGVCGGVDRKLFLFCSYRSGGARWHADGSEECRARKSQLKM